MSKRNLLCQVFSFMLLATPFVYGSDQVKGEATPDPVTNTYEGLTHQDTNSDEGLNIKEEIEDSASAKGKKKKKK